MKKNRSYMIPVLMMLLLLGVTACNQDLTPTSCETGQHIENGECIEDEETLTCNTGYVLENGTCIEDDPITCEEGQHIEDDTCVDDEDIYSNSTLVSLEEMMNNLLENAFTSNTYTTTELGVSNMTNLGVDEESFNQVLYPVPNDTVGTTYNVLDYGITPEKSNNAIPMNTLINSLKGVDGIKKIYFPEGLYRFGSSIVIEDIEDLYLYGNNTEFIYSGWISAIKISDSENIHINNISFDYDPSPTISGEINHVNLTNKEITIKVNNEFDLSNPIYNNGKINYGSYIEFRYDQMTNSYIPNENGNLLYNSTGDQKQNIIDGVYNNSTKELVLTFKTMKNVAVGTKVSVAYTMYDAHGISIDESKNVYLESLNIYTSPGMTVRSDQTENMYINNVNVMLKEGSSRLMTATADIIHTCGNYGDLIVTNGIYEYSHDDAMNFKGFYRTVSKANGRIITAQAANSEANLLVEAGDYVEIYNPANFELYGTYKVTEVTRSGLVATITLDKTIRDDIEGFLVGNVTKSPNLVVKNNIIRNKRNRGLLIQVRNSEVTNNTFQNILHGTLSYLSVADIFSEAIMPQNITVQNNKFINNNTLLGLQGDVAIMTYGQLGYSNGGTTSGTITNINISNNFFYKGGNAAVSFLGGGQGLVENNLFYDTTTKFRDQSYNTVVRIFTSEDIVVRNNVTYMISRDFDFIKEDEYNQLIVVENNNLIKD